MISEFCVFSMHEAFRIKYTIGFVLSYSISRFYFYLTKKPPFGGFFYTGK